MCYLGIIEIGNRKNCVVGKSDWNRPKSFSLKLNAIWPFFSPPWKLLAFYSSRLLSCETGGRACLNSFLCRNLSRYYLAVAKMVAWQTSWWGFHPAQKPSSSVYFCMIRSQAAVAFGALILSELPENIRIEYALCAKLQLCLCLCHRWSEIRSKVARSQFGRRKGMPNAANEHDRCAPGKTAEMLQVRRDHLFHFVINMRQISARFACKASL